MIEFGNDNAATLESQIDRRFRDFCEKVSSEATKGALVTALEAAPRMGGGGQSRRKDPPERFAFHSAIPWSNPLSRSFDKRYKRRSREQSVRRILWEKWPTAECEGLTFAHF